MRKILTLAGAAALGLTLAASCGSSSASTSGSQTVAWSATATTHPVPPAHPATLPDRRAGSTFDYCSVHTGDCWRDPSGGPIGTFILDSTLSGSDSEDWVLQANGRCGGQVTSTCPGGWISSALQGGDVVTLRNVGSSDSQACLGANAAGSWDAKLFTCDGANGASVPATVFIWEPGSTCPGGISGVGFWSWSYNNSGALIDNNGTVNNTNVDVGTRSVCSDQLWTQTGS